MSGKKSNSYDTVAKVKKKGGSSSEKPFGKKPVWLESRFTGDQKEIPLRYDSGVVGNIHKKTKQLAVA